MGCGAVSEIMERPPVRDIPVAVAGDLVLVREPGIVVSAGAFTVLSSGFGFELHIAADMSDPAVRLPQDMFSVERDWRAHSTWMSIGYSDGRACDACIQRCTLPGDENNRESKDIKVKFMFNPDESAWSSRWWVSPLPPPGPLELTVHLDGHAGPVGTASLDAGVLLAAASMVEKVDAYRTDTSP
jgi:hypothetical protein